jgi:hypothetical protein
MLSRAPEPGSTSLTHFQVAWQSCCLHRALGTLPPRSSQRPPWDQPPRELSRAALLARQHSLVLSLWGWSHTRDQGIHVSSTTHRASQAGTEVRTDREGPSREAEQGLWETGSW